MGKKKIIIAVVVLLLGAGGGFFFMKSKGEKVEPKVKIEGVVHTMSPEYLVNLTDGSMAKVNVALLLDHHDPSVEAAAAAGGGHGAAPAAGEITPHPQEPLLREIVTDGLGAASGAQLNSKTGRLKVLKKIAQVMNKTTDAKVERVLITDITLDG